MAQEFDIAKLSQYIINKKGIVWIQDVLDPLIWLLGRQMVKA